MIYQQQLIIIMNLTNWVCYVCLCVSSPMRQLWIRTREFLIRWQPSGARRMRSCNWNWRTARRRAAPTWWRSTCWRRKARITWWLSARRTKPSQVLSNLSITADHNLQAFEERKIWSSVLTVVFLFLCHFLSEEIKSWLSAWGGRLQRPQAKKNVEVEKEELQMTLEEAEASLEAEDVPYFPSVLKNIMMLFRKV